MSSWGTRASYSDTSCDILFLVFFFFFQSEQPTQYQETHSTLNEKKKWGWWGDGLTPNNQLQQIIL